MSSTSIILIPLLLLALSTNAFTTQTTGVRQGRWASGYSSTLSMSAVEKSVTAEEINSRLEAQLEKLKAKDATSTALSKEVGK